MSSDECCVPQMGGVNVQDATSDERFAQNSSVVSKPLVDLSNFSEEDKDVPI